MKYLQLSALHCYEHGKRWQILASFRDHFHNSFDKFTLGKKVCKYSTMNVAINVVAFSSNSRTKAML